MPSNFHPSLKDFLCKYLNETIMFPNFVENRIYIYIYSRIVKTAPTIKQFLQKKFDGETEIQSDPTILQLYLYLFFIFHWKGNIFREFAARATMDMGDWTTSSSAEPSAYNTPSTTPTPTPVKKTEYICRWDGCGHEVDASADLADHVTCNHAQAQIKKNAKKFICLWDGCKVYNTPSLSQTWLLKHVLDHCGAKPFRCLFSGCNQSFRTQSGQERHVQSHFSASEQPSPQQRTSRSKDDSPGKITKKKRSRMKKRLSLRKFRVPDRYDHKRRVCLTVFKQ